MIDRENMVKLVENTGKYMHENASEIVPQNVKLKELTITVQLSVDFQIPRIIVNSESEPLEILKGVKFST